MLVPVFGPDFVAMCRKHSDPDFQNLNVDRDIILKCEEEALAIQEQSRESSLANSPKQSSAFSELPIWPPPKSQRPKKFKGMDVESGYGTDTDRTEMYSSYPGSPMYGGWTPVNTPKIPIVDGPRVPQPAQGITSSPWIKASLRDSSKAKSSKRPGSHEDPAEGLSIDPCSESGPVPQKRRKVSRALASKVSPEIEAAYTLMHLHAADATLIKEEKEKEKEGRRRRASA